MEKEPNKNYPAKSLSRVDASATVESILDAAQKVIVKNGYARFTMRRVAQSAGISPGNLTYHFPTKNALLRALIIRLMEDYSCQLDKILSGLEGHTEQQVNMLVHWVLMDNVDEITVRTGREIWAMALHDNIIRNAVDDFYDELIERLVNMLQRSRPNSDKTTIREMVYFLVLLAEGTSVLYGTRRERPVPVERMIEVVILLIKSLAPKP